MENINLIGEYDDKLNFNNIIYNIDNKINNNKYKEKTNKKKKLKKKINKLKENEINEFINIFDNKLKINIDIDMKKDINDVINKLDKIDINKNKIYTNIYVSTYNITNPKIYKKNIIYLNLISILVNKSNNIEFMNSELKLFKNINKTYIKYKSKLKYKNNYFMIIYLNKRYNFNKFGYKWKDIYNFYNLYNIEETNSYEYILNNNDNEWYDFNMKNINKEINISCLNNNEININPNNNSNIILKLKIKHIFDNIIKKYNFIK